ncbi:MAG: CAP domain-containing protein [Myxococcales bacterium]
MLLALLVCAAIPQQRALEDALREAAAASCKGRRVEVDPDLSRAARAFVSAVQEERAPLVASALSFYAGLESTAPASVGSVATISPPSLADRAVGDLVPKTCAFDRAGIAAGEIPGGRAVVALLTATQPIRLRAIPGRVVPGAEVTIDGSLSAGLRDPKLFVSQPGGAIEERSLRAESSRVREKVRLPRKGEAVVEILATGPGGPQVVAIRRIFVGVAPPLSPPPEPADRDPGIAGVEAGIARLRAQHGLPALRRDAELDAVAELHSREMARTGTFAHVLPSDGNVGDRLDRAGYARRAAGENIGLGETPLAAHAGIASSPAHLSNLLDPRFSRVGLGTARGPSPDGAEGIYLTEVLASPVRGSKDPEGDVSVALQRMRAQRGLAALERDSSLDEAATKRIQRAAFADAALSASEQETMVRTLLREDARFDSAAAETYIVSAPDEIVSRNAVQPGWTHFGVGALYKSSRTYGPGRLWVLLVFTR